MGNTNEDHAMDANTAAISAHELSGIRSAWLFYRVMAWIVGALLVVLVVIGMPMKYIWQDGSIVVATGMPHGWLYMVLLIAVYNLGRRIGWSWKWFAAIMLAGTIPFLSFLAEYYATKNVREVMAKAAATN